MENSCRHNGSVPEWELLTDEVKLDSIVEESEPIHNLSEESFFTEMYFVEEMNNFTVNTDIKNIDEGKDHSLSDYSEEYYEEVQISPPFRHYKHTRNEKLNRTLDLLLALVLTGAIGLGIGNFLGSSNICIQNHPFVMKKQQEILSCVNDCPFTEVCTHDFYPKVQKDLNSKVDIVFFKDCCTVLHSESKSNYDDFNNKATKDINLRTNNDVLAESISENEEMENLTINNDINSILLTQSNNTNEHLELKSVILSFINKNHNESSDIYLTQNVTLEHNSNDYFKNLQLALKNIENFLAHSFSNEKLSPALFIHDHDTIFKTEESSAILKKYVNDIFLHQGNNLLLKLANEVEDIIKSTFDLLLSVTHRNEEYSPKVEMYINITSNVFNNFIYQSKNKIVTLRQFVISSALNTSPQHCMKVLKKMIDTVLISVDKIIKIISNTMKKNDSLEYKWHKISKKCLEYMTDYDKKFEINIAKWVKKLNKSKPKKNFKEYKEKHKYTKNYADRKLQNKKYKKHEKLSKKVKKYKF